MTENNEMQNNTTTITPAEEITSFEDLHLDRKIINALKDMGFEEPSPIQKGAIPLALEGEDLIGQAQTGTGKTADAAGRLSLRLRPMSRLSSEPVATSDVCLCGASFGVSRCFARR